MEVCSLALWTAHTSPLIITYHNSFSVATGGSGVLLPAANTLTRGQSLGLQRLTLEGPRVQREVRGVAGVKRQEARSEIHF